MSFVSDLYAPLIERDLAAIPAAVAKFRARNDSDELFLAIARFAVLAFAPSEHSKHALLAIDAAHDLRSEFGDRWDELLIECARYAAASRQPWSEPPLFDPPALDPHQGRDVEVLRSAISAQDRLAGERWLAGSLHDSELEGDLAAVASDDFEDFGANLVLTSAALRLSRVLGEKGRFAVLRVAVWQMASAGRRRTRDSGFATRDSEDVLRRLLAATGSERGSIESVHRLFLFDAAVETGSERALWHLDAVAPRIAASSGVVAPPADPPGVCPLSRDYAQSLIARAVAKRLSRRFPSVDLEALVSAAEDNRLHGESFDEFSLP